MRKPASQRVKEGARGATVIRPRDLERQGIPRGYLRRLVDRGELERVERGLYAVPDADVTELHTWVEATKRVPHGVICLLSALRFHDLTTQNPFEVWMAIPQKSWRPRGTRLPLRFCYLSEKPFQAGIETHEVEGVELRVYSAAKTVADCFKFRNKVGLDVALEAMRDYRRVYRTGAGALWQAAKICRVTRVMQPYLETAG